MVGKEGYSSKEKGQVRFREGLRKQVVCVCMFVCRGVPWGDGGGTLVTRLNPSPTLKGVYW